MSALAYFKKMAEPVRSAVKKATPTASKKTASKAKAKGKA